MGGVGQKNSQRNLWMTITCWSSSSSSFCTSQNSEGAGSCGSPISEPDLSIGLGNVDKLIISLESSLEYSLEESDWSGLTIATKLPGFMFFASLGLLFSGLEVDRSDTSSVLIEFFSVVFCKGFFYDL